MLGLLTQIKIFILTMSLGVLAGLIIHFYQLSMKAMRTGKHILYLLDIMLWLFMILVVSLGMLLINEGALRAYTFLFLVAGVIIYFKLLASYLFRPLQAIAEACVYFLAKLAGLFIKPGLRLIHKIAVKWRNHRSQKPPEDPLP